MRYTYKTARMLNAGDVIKWNSGYFDTVERVEEDKLGDIRARFNDDTLVISFNPEDTIRIVKL